MTRLILTFLLAAMAFCLFARADKAAAATTAPTSLSAGRMRAKEPVVPNKIPDACRPVAYAAQRLDPQSCLGRRVDINFRTGLLRTFDVDLYLDSYGQNPKWPSGEYLGKFMQGLSAMYLYSGEPAAKERLDKIIAVWRRVQAPDGWLGTTERFKSWDIWEHKYVLLGLLDYYALTGDADALEAARKIGDLFCAHFGPNLNDIMQSGHWAMGSASILEPMVYLYRYTAQRKYFDFCQYIADAFEGPTGPKIISTLTTGSKRVCDIEDPWASRAAREIKFSPNIGQVRNRSKAYEMLSCIIGLARLYQLTGKPEYLAAAVNAWEDIASKRLYIAGSSGADECFKDDHCLPAETSDGPAEGCVTAHWIYLSRLLFEITGEARYADAIENALYNYLLASQRPQDCYQSYNTGMNGVKNFARHDPSGKVRGAPCCISSVMREIARTPEAVWTKFAGGGLGVVLYQKGRMEDTIKTADGESLSVRIEVDTDFPRSGEAALRVWPQRAAAFHLALRVPAWAKDFKAAVAGRTYTGKAGQFLNLERVWQRGDTVQITTDLNERLVSGGASYPGCFAFLRGPQVLSLVARKEGEANLDRARVKANTPVQLVPADGFLPGGWIGGQVYASPALVEAHGCALVPFADAGQPGLPARYRTWIPLQPGTGMPVPAAPSGLKAAALGANHIRLVWNDRSRDEDGFRVERRRADVGMWFHVKTTASNVTACVDNAVNVVLPGKTYTYRVAAYNAGGLSAYSEEVAVTTPDGAGPAAASVYQRPEKP
ncbi:MAG: glycoside hydrolase family 127 protein [Candidatus Sumerlaeia bacterium]|nr:glycoside hydrolase family 127 protein [Candidatus Sumerlaeia bacterium]